MGKTRVREDKRHEVIIPYARSRITAKTGDYEFYYPKGIRWKCKRCASCCRDASHRPRRILLLPSDIEKLEKAGETKFTTEVKCEDPFKAEMRKDSGACVFLTEKECRIYSNRALLCRMYPFWVEKEGRSLEVRIDTRCPGFGHGSELKEEYFRELLTLALNLMESNKLHAI